MRDIKVFDVVKLNKERLSPGLKYSAIIKNLSVLFGKEHPLALKTGHPNKSICIFPKIMRKKLQ